MNPYAAFAVVLTIFTWLAYWFNFSHIHGLPISDNVEVWGQFGDFIGGVLNPTLGFVSILLLLKSLDYQKVANDNLKTEIDLIRKTEKLKSFEAQFFNMLDSQKQVFESFTIELTQGKTAVVLRSAEAVVTIERTVQHLREKGDSDAEIGQLLESSDEKDRLFGMIRTFYILVKITCDTLSNVNGFTAEDRKSHLLTLIHFTDFHLLRLILISMQFLNYSNVQYLNECSELNEVLNEVGLNGRY
ncbi:hypothetical protein [Pseudoalteromonas piscicida]